MTARDGKNIASLVISFLVFGSGISLSVLIYELVRKAVQDVAKEEMSSLSSLNSDSNDGLSFNFDDTNQMTNQAFAYTGPLWLIGLGFILPGAFGLLAGGVRKRWAYIVHLVLGIKGLLIMAVFFVLGVLALGVLSTQQGMDCKQVADKCMCRSSSFSDYEDMGMKSCDLFDHMYSLGLAIVIILVVAWVLMLVDTILTGINACKRQDVSNGAVIIRAPVQTNFVKLDEVAAPPVVYTHDEAVLVRNY